jgi:penicillin-binding protein 2
MYLLDEQDDRQEESRSPMSVRIAVLGGLAIAMFSIVFFRLWYLQVLSGDRYLDRAKDNQVREVRDQGPRGEIMDSTGNVLVGNRLGMALEVSPDDLPDDRTLRRQELSSLGQVTGIDPAEIRKTLGAQDPTVTGGKVIIKRDLGADEIYYLREHQADFPGVEIDRVFNRTYKDGDLAAQLFGQVGQVTKEQLGESRFSSLQQGDQVGQSGVEYEYDRFLRGRIGDTKIPIDARGRPTGNPRVTPASPGDNVRLTIDPSVQATGEAALGSFGLPGAFVAMDVHSGGIIAMGSRPTIDPSVFSKPLSAATYKALTSKNAGSPLVDRAISGAYPTGSVFKPITAVAALQGGLLTPTTTVFDGGTLKVDVLELHNAKDAVFGTLDLPNALRVSSDIFFFKLGLRAPAKGSGGLIQDWARNLGLGSQTGIDLPNEAPGFIPNPAWRNKLYAEKKTDRPWTLGDNINLSVGQGDLQADPLQMAVAYAALGNGGDVVVPHVVDRVEDVSGRALEEVHPDVRRHVDIDEANRQAILSGLNAAAMSVGGTSYPVFGNFPVQIMGKTGTAERAPHPDQAWYIAMAPYPNPRIVVAVTIEQGGFGVDTAAPVAQQILADYLNVKPGPPAVNPVDSTTTE